MGKKEASGRPAAVEQSCDPRGVLRALSAEELALRSQQGCQDSFTELVERDGVRLYQFLHNKTDNVHDAEDLVQDTFIKRTVTSAGIELRGSFRPGFSR